MRNVVSCIAALTLIVACGSVRATTWSPVTRECPVCGAEVELEAIASYGGYIYRWPSKFQLVFWPHTADRGVYHCPDCHFACFLEHWGDIDPAQAQAIRAALAEAEVDDEDVAYHEVPILQRLALAEAAYAQRQMDDTFWCFFHRVRGYHLEEAGRTAEAAEARNQALEIAVGLLAAADPGAPRKELQFVIGSMKLLLGDEEGGRTALDGVAATPMTGKTGMSEADLESYGEYLDSLATELLADAPAQAPALEMREPDELVKPLVTFVSVDPSPGEGFPTIAGGPRDHVRREAWIERKLARPALSRDERLALMADMARRYEEKADEALLLAYEEYDARFEANLQSEDPDDLSDGPDFSVATAHWQGALGWLQRAAAEAEGHAWRPRLLQRQGLVLGDLERRDELLETAQLLQHEAPDSAPGQWAATTVGDHHFGECVMDPAIDSYRIAETGPDPALALYATYKRAWCHYNLGEVEQAAAALDAVIAGAGTGDEYRQLRIEATRDRQLFEPTQ